MRPQLDMRDYLLPSDTEIELSTLIQQLENGETLVLSSSFSGVLPVDGHYMSCLSVRCYPDEIGVADRISNLKFKLFIINSICFLLFLFSSFFHLILPSKLNTMSSSSSVLQMS